MINIFPKAISAGGVFPRELFTGIRVDYQRDCKLGFGEYVQVSADSDITNTMQPRTYGAISLGSVGNMQGTDLFMSLLTWKVIRRRNWVEMPLAGEIIDLINRKVLSGASTSSDVNIRVGNNMIDEELTRRMNPKGRSQIRVQIWSQWTGTIMKMKFKICPATSTPWWSKSSRRIGRQRAYRNRTHLEANMDGMDVNDPAGPPVVLYPEEAEI
jgi:hypothetical protein